MAKLSKRDRAWRRNKIERIVELQTLRCRIMIQYQLVAERHKRFLAAMVQHQLVGDYNRNAVLH